MFFMCYKYVIDMVCKKLPRPGPGALQKCFIGGEGRRPVSARPSLKGDGSRDTVSEFKEVVDT